MSFFKNLFMVPVIICVIIFDMVCLSFYASEIKRLRRKLEKSESVKAELLRQHSELVEEATQWR